MQREGISRAGHCATLRQCASSVSLHTCKLAAPGVLVHACVLMHQPSAEGLSHSQTNIQPNKRGKTIAALAKRHASPEPSQACSVAGAMAYGTRCGGQQQLPQHTSRGFKAVTYPVKRVTYTPSVRSDHVMSGQMCQASSCLVSQSSRPPVSQTVSLSVNTITHLAYMADTPPCRADKKHASSSCTPHHRGWQMPPPSASIRRCTH